MTQIQDVLPSCSAFLNFEFLRILGTAPFHGSEVGESLEVAAKLKNNDPEVWWREWSSLAERAEQTGKDALRSGDTTTARWAFLRACNYRRTSEFLLHHLLGDPRMLLALNQSTEDFKTACSLFEEQVVFLDIPYQKSSRLPGYLFLPKSPPVRGTKTPVLVITGGFDGTQEELYFPYVAGALPRGYAAVLFEGPGQGVVARRKEDRLHLRPDWEVVTAAVLDELFRLSQEHPEWDLDLDKVALAGPSMGAYFALRGATDPRVAACISLDGFYNLREIVQKRMPSVMIRAIDRGWISDAVLDHLIWLVGKLDFQARWETGHGILACGIQSPAGVLREFVSRYKLQGLDGQPFLNNVKCPVLVTGAPDSIYFSMEAGARRIYNELNGLQRDPETRLWAPETPGQGSLQAKVAALASLHENVFGWLDHIFGIIRVSGKPTENNEGR